MNKKVIKPLFFLSFAFCLAFLSPLSTFAEEDILNGTDEEILKDSNEEILNNCENAIDVWSDSKLRRYAEDNILYYDDQFECEKGKSEPEPENPCIGDDSAIIVGDNAWSIVNSLRATGYNNTSIAGIMGNLKAENSKYEPRLSQHQGIVPEDYRLYDEGLKNRNSNAVSDGLGIAQWTWPSRQKNLQRYADETGSKVTSLKTQIEFLIRELTGQEPDSIKINIGPSILNNMTLEEVSNKVLMDFEGPDNASSKIPIRKKYSEEWYNRIIAEDPGDSNETPIPSDENCTPSEDDGYTGPVEIDEGGLTLEDAKTLVQNYGFYKEDSNSVVGDILWNMCNGGGSNCVTFSAFFVNKFTNHPYISGNGATFSIKGLSPAGGPDVFSVFRSRNKEPVWNEEKQRWENNGHTGVILGYHDGKYIVGHASCRRQKSGKGDGLKSGNGSAFVVEETAELPTSWTYPGTNYYQFEFFQLKDSVDINKLKAYIEHGP